MVNNIYYSKTALTGGAAGDLDSIDGASLVDGDIAHVFVNGQLNTYKLNASSSETENSPFIITPDATPGTKRWYLMKSTAGEMVSNLKPYVNVAVNKLDIFTKSGGAVADAANIITVAIPDGNGYTFRSRTAAYLSGTSQFIMADAANYWSKGSLDAEIKNAYIYAIWDAAGGIVWALGGYSGFTRVPASTTATDDDFFLLEASSTYTKVITDYCVCVAKIRYQYDTADTPDHTIQATALDAPQVVWNPKSDYGYSKSLATTVTQASVIPEVSYVSTVVKQSGNYLISGQSCGYGTTTYTELRSHIKTGNAAYASAVYKASAKQEVAGGYRATASTIPVQVYLNAGDTIHLGAFVDCAAGAVDRTLYADDAGVGKMTYFSFIRVG